MRHNEQTWRGELALLRRQLRVVLPVALLSFALLLVILTGALLPDRPLLQGVLIVVTLFAVSLALFDVLTGIFFGGRPMPSTTACIVCWGNLRINIEVLP